MEESSLIRETGEPIRRPAEVLWEWSVVSLVFVAVSILAASTQSPITYHNGEGWDGTDYCAMARCFAAGRRPAAGAPFVNRLAAPFLAALINPHSPIEGFRRLALAACAVTIVLFVLWLRFYISDWRIRILVVLLYSITFFNPPRFLHYYAATTDAITHVALLAGFLLLYHLDRAPTRVAALSMTAFTILAVPVREFMMMFSIALLFRDNIVAFDPEAPSIFRLVRPPSLWLLMPVVSGILTLITIRLWVITLPNWYNFHEHIGGMLFHKSLVPYFHGWFIAFGPVLALLIWKIRSSAAFLWAHQPILAMFLGIAALGWIAGTDTERFLAWSFPVTFVLLGRIIERNRQMFRSPLLVSLLVISQTIAQRLYWPMPDFPPTIVGRYWVVLTMWGTQIDPRNLYSWHARSTLAAISFAEYVALMTALVVWLRHVELETAKQQITLDIPVADHVLRSSGS
jgi:hypothetical protein